MKDKIKIDSSCEPYMYNTKKDLTKIKIGDVLDLTFGKKPLKVKKEYVNKTIRFIVNNYLEHTWRRTTRRLALVPLDKKDNFEESDILILDDYDRFECLMIDLFPINRRPYSGWQNKTVTFTKVTE